MPPHSPATPTIDPTPASGRRSHSPVVVHDPASFALEGVTRSSFRAVSLSSPWGGRHAGRLVVRTRSGDDVEVELEPSTIFACDPSVNGGMRRETYVGHHRRLWREHSEAMRHFSRVPLDHAPQRLTLEIIDIPVGTRVRIDLVSAIEAWPQAGYRETDHGPRRIRAGRVADLTRRPAHPAPHQPALPPTSEGALLPLAGGGAMLTAVTSGLSFAGFLWAIPLATVSAVVVLVAGYRLIEPYL